MRYSNTQFEAVPNFIRPNYNKPKRSTFSEHTAKNNKKFLPKRHHEIFIQQILDGVIENVIIIDKKKSEKQLFLVSYIEEIFNHIMEIQYFQKQQNFGIIQDQPTPQTNTKTKEHSQQPIFQSQLSSIQPPEVVQVISKRLTFLNRTSNPFKMLPAKVTDQEDDYINQLRQQYLKVLEIARIKKLKKNRSTIVNRSSIIVGSKKMTSFITQNILTQVQSQDKNKQQVKEQQLKILDVKVNKPRIASYCQIQQQQTPIMIKHQSQHISTNKQQSTNLKIKRISKNISSSYQKLPAQQLKSQQTKLKHHEKSLSEFTRIKKKSLLIIPNTLNDVSNINKQDRPKSKRVTENDKDIKNVKLLIQNKRSSLPQNAIKIFSQNKLKRKQQINIQIKQEKEIIKKTQHSKSNNEKENKNMKHANNNTHKKVVSSSNNRHVINKTKNYTLQSEHISQNNSTSISSSIRQSLIHPTANLIKSKFGNGKDPQSKHQIIQLLQALDSPHTVNLQKAYSPIPLRLQKIRKYLNNSSKHKQ